MTAYVALLRGINVGGNKKVAMADLRSLLGGLGYENVKTHLNSGNAVFTATGKAATLEKDISAAIDRVLGMDVKVIVRSAAQLDTVVKKLPFKGDTKSVAAVFLAGQPPAAKVKEHSPEAYAPNEFAFGDKVVYIRQPNGFAGSTLPDWHKVLGVTATARKWSVVTKLQEMLHDL
jgi:uncharacterized protein (DUF1697 family)